MKSNNKITLLISSLGGGGAEGVCVNIANKLANNGWKVDLVVSNLINETYLGRLSENVTLIVLNVKHARYTSIPLLKYIYKNRIKTILVFNHELAIILVMIRIFFKLKIKIISRNISIMSIKIEQLKLQNFWKRNVVRPLTKYFYNKIDHVINQSIAMREDLISIYPKLDRKSSVIYNPISNYIINYANNNDLNKVEKKNYLLCVGRLEKVKALDYAIDGFAGIANKFPNLRLKIIGKGTMEQKLKQKVIDCKIQNKVDFEGFQKNIVPYYLYARATIQTSHYEGYPNVLIESIAMNTPVVAFDCPGGTKEIIKNGINGYLVKQHSVEDLKKKLLKLLSNEFNYKDLKMSIINNQIEHICKNYEKIIYSYL